MASSTGKRLQEARLIRGLSLEDVQHRTRIRLNQLVGMENEDLSVFAGPAYARGFYALYGRFLGVDLTEFLEAMEPGRLSPVKSHRYLRPSADRVGRGRRARPKHLQPLPQASRLALLATALAMVIGTTAWFSHLYWRRNDLGQQPAAAAAEAAAVNLPLLAGTASASAAAQPVATHPATNVAGDPSAEALSQPDVRSTPPPVLKALPVEDPAHRRVRPDGAGGLERAAPPEVRRPAPFTR